MEKLTDGIQKENLLVAARQIEEHCEKNNFYAGEGTCTCVFAEIGETCPFEEGSGIPADWGV